MHFIIVEEQAQEQEILVNAGFPENAEVPVFYIGQWDKGYPEKIKFHPGINSDHGNTRHSPVRQEAQAVGTDKGEHTQHTQNPEINLCSVLQRQEQGNKHAEYHAQIHAEIHQLPVPLENHGQQNDPTGQKGKHHPPIRQKRLPVFPAAYQEKDPCRRHDRKHQKLGLVKAQDGTGIEGIPVQKQDADKEGIYPDFRKFPVRKWIQLHFFPSPAISRIALYRFSAPRSTAMPP